MDEKNKNYRLYGNNDDEGDSYTPLNDDESPIFTFEDSSKNEYVRVSQSVKTKAVDKKFDQQFFETVMNDKKSNLKAFALISFFVVLFVGLIIFTYFFVNKPVEDNNLIYSGVYVNGYNLGGLTKDEVAEYITKTYFEPISNANIIVRLGENDKSYSLANFVVCPDAKAIAEQAYSVGRTGTESEKITTIKALETNPISIAIEYSIVTDDMTEIIAQASEQGYEVATNPTYDIREEGVVFTSGKPGLSVDLSKFKSDLNTVIANYEEAIANIASDAKLDDQIIEVNLIEADFVHLNAATIKQEAYLESTSAYYARKGSKLTDEIYVHDGVYGRTLSDDDLASIVNRINDGETINYFLLEYEYFEDEVSVESLEAKMYVDILAEVTTVNEIDKYSGIKEIGLENRQINIQKACKLLGTVQLLPGDSLKLSEVIGTLSESKGFTETYENTANGSRETIGGGICQFATALYEAAVRANLGTQASHNKYLPYYGMLGFDAVYDNENDLIIRNTTSEPIKITPTFKNNVLTFVIEGKQGNTTVTALYADGPVYSSVSNGTKYSFTVSRDVGVTKVDMGIVSYISVGEKMPTPTPDGTPVVTETPGPSATPSPTPTPGESETSLPSETPTPSETPAPSETVTPTETPLPSETPMPSESPIPTETNPQPE